MMPSSQRLPRSVPARERSSSTIAAYAGGYTARKPMSAIDGYGALGSFATVNVQIVSPIPQAATAVPIRIQASRSRRWTIPRRTHAAPAASMTSLYTQSLRTPRRPPLR